MKQSVFYDLTSSKKMFNSVTVSMEAIRSTGKLDASKSTESCRTAAKVLQHHCINPRQWGSVRLSVLPSFVKEANFFSNKRFKELHVTRHGFDSLQSHKVE